MNNETPKPATDEATPAAAPQNEQVVGYSVTPEGLRVNVKGSGGEIKNVWLCSALRIEACTRDDVQGGWGRLIVFHDPDGHEHRINVQMRLLCGSGDAVIAELMDRGVQVSQAQGAKRLIVDYQQHERPARRARTVNKTGWYGEQFVLPEQVIGSGAEILLYQLDSQSSHAYHCQGTLLEWQQQVARPCVGNSRLVLAVSTAFAAPLLGYVNGESGGVSITGTSSTGKTTALFVAASVCGEPDYLQRWRATSNGLESVATLHNDSLLILDELAQIDPREAGETAYMLANGAGKIRATKTGGARGKSTWRLLFLSAGEVSLAEHMSAAGKIARAGQEIRLVDVPADAGSGMGLFEILHGHNSGAQFSEALKLASSRFYGVALVEYLRKLTLEKRHIIIKQIEDYKEEFINRVDLARAGGQARRVASRFALIAAGGELASSLGVTGWEAGEAINAAVVSFQAWVDTREGTGQQEHKKFVGRLRHYLEQHGESRFTPFDDCVGTTKTINRAGFRKHDLASDTYTYYILTNVWTNEVCNGLNSTDMSVYLLNCGILKRSNNNKAYCTVRLPGMGSTRCYVVTSAVFGEEYGQTGAADPAPAPEKMPESAPKAEEAEGACYTCNTCNLPWDDEEVPF